MRGCLILTLLKAEGTSTERLAALFKVMRQPTSECDKGTLVFRRLTAADIQCVKKYDIMFIGTETISCFTMVSKSYLLEIPKQALNILNVVAIMIDMTEEHTFQSLEVVEITVRKT